MANWGAPNGAPLLFWPRSGPEEPFLEVFQAPLELIEDAGDPGRDDLHAPIAGDPQLVTGLHRRLHRRARGDDGEDDLVLLFHDRADLDLPVGHRLDQRPELGV